MSPQQVLAVSVRLFALWLLLYGATHIAGDYFYARTPGLQISPFIPIALVLILGFLCGLLWAFPLFVAKKILPISTEASTQTPLFENWFSVGCSLIGLFALSKAIPALVDYYVINAAALKLYPHTFVVSPDWPLHAGFNILQLIFGVWLFLGGKGLKKILMWARHV
jgi:hypothetical protein